MTDDPIAQPLKCERCGFLLIINRTWSQSNQRKAIFVCIQCTRDQKKAKQHKDNTESPNNRHKVLRQKITKFGLPCDLFLKDYKKLIAQPCFYCGGPLNPTGVGLDQKIPGAGYTKENAVPCCWNCNRIKLDIYSADEMQVIGKAIAAVMAARGPDQPVLITPRGDRPLRHLSGDV
jgi:hypothetical protein